VHAAYISRQLQAAAEASLTQKQVAAIRYKDGVYFEFSGAENHELAIKSLENLQQGIRLLNVKHDGDIVKATVYIPAGKESYFLSKVQEYAKPTDEEKKPKNNDLVRSIENVKLAMLESFWIGDQRDMPDETSCWCEIWVRFDETSSEEVEKDFVECCTAIDIVINARHIVFPERIVRLVKANKEQLKDLIARSAYIAEIRRAPESTAFFDELPGWEQQDWIKELLSRTSFQNTNATVCLLDSGLSAEHPLLAPAVIDQGIQSVEEAWGIGDHLSHGTEMAGIALYKDLKACLAGNGLQNVAHKLESVKILPPNGHNHPDLYGAVTERAVSLAEIANPDAERAICMAITTSEYNTTDGSPTSWSAALDSIISGADSNDEKRLFFVSAGNVEPTETGRSGFPDANLLHSVENPGQSWNAITVGAYTNDVHIESDGFHGFMPVADLGNISPYSSTSRLWADIWPIKPEILLDGGNVATNGEDYTECPDLSLLTTYSKPTIRLLSTIWGTSSATAQAAWMAAQIYIEYPGIWPETVRALLVHSARWTVEMKNQFLFDEAKTRGRKNLLRTCGYGVPQFEKAIHCIDNSVNLVVQASIQPYTKIGSTGKMNEMHLHKIPWPTEVLRSLGNTEVELRVTLSYFIEPGPGEKGWKNRYRYPSCGLQFDVINSNEEVEDFEKRINVRMRGEDKNDRGEGDSGSSRWYLGSDNRDVGSIHSDFIIDSAINLCKANYIAVYPIIGWWRERSYLGKCESKVRYSLVITISTPSEKIDLYTPIITSIPNYVEVEIPVK
jgi:hypothetical protein